ncbi:MAG: recombinase RecA [Candidatus Omnitrophica bacterium]|nr:recombinase RecA [Candidatus Omnitrophota bacterium]
MAAREQQEKERADRLKALELTLSQIEKQFGKGSIMRLGQDTKLDIPAISTGSLAIDLALGIGGVPRGRVVEIFGPESSGKTTLSLSILVEAQRAGGVAAFIDAEHALDPTYAKTLGVNLDDLLVSQPDTGEQALEIAETLVRSNAVDVVVIDSVAALVPRAEIEGEMGDQFVGLQARLMSQALRKLTAAIARSKTCCIFINQLREKIGVMFGCFAYSTRVVLADGTTEKIGKIVNQRLPVEVLSMDPRTGEISPRKIAQYFRNGETDEWLSFEVEAAGGPGRRKFTCTSNHLIFTPGGKRPAGEIKEGEEVLVAVEHYAISPDQEQLLLGGVLGDGALRRTSTHKVTFRIGHGLRQHDYLTWKHDMLAPFAHAIAPTGKGLGFDTIPMKQLAWLHEAVYYGRNGGKQAVTEEVVRRLDARAIAIWYADDGSFSGSYDRWGHGKAEIYAKSLSRDDRELLAHHCEGLGMGRPTVTHRGLLFSGERTRLLHERIAPYVHPSMAYKLHPDLRGRFEWQPDASDAHLNGTRLKSRTTFRAEPMKVVKKRRMPALPRKRTRFDLEIEGNHTYLVDHVVVHNSPETTPGGRALKFYASVRIDLRRIESIKAGDRAVGNRVRAKIVKNKVAPPFRQAEFDILFDEGISKAGSLLDVGETVGVIQRQGSWLSTGDTKLGQGRESARLFLKENPKLMQELDAQIRQRAAQEGLREKEKGKPEDADAPLAQRA